MDCVASDSNPLLISGSLHDDLDHIVSVYYVSAALTYEFIQK